MMSSAISIEEKPASKARARQGRSYGGSGNIQAAVDDGGFRVWHFFVLLSLLAATVAVVMMRQGRPEVLILVSATIGAAGAAAIGFYRMLAPLAATDAELVREPLSARLRADLEREKALTLRSIKELEFDCAMGKLSSQDFDEMAGRLRARAIGIMKQIDADRSPYRAVIEKELAARLGSDPGQTGDRPGSDAGQTGSRRLAGACAACGTVNDHDARFCKTCGNRLDATDGEERHG
jgi:hypothetical protein